MDWSMAKFLGLCWLGGWFIGLSIVPDIRHALLACAGVIVIWLAYRR